jgi:hypothetical protein
MSPIPAVVPTTPYHHLWESIRGVLREQRQHRDFLAEELSFFVYRSDTNAVLARGIFGYEEAKNRADPIRRSQGLPWSVVKFKAERGNQASAAGGSSGTTPKKQFGVSRDGKTFTNTSGQSGRVDYAKRYNPSKGRRFRGYTDAQGNYHDID